MVVMGSCTCGRRRSGCGRGRLFVSISIVISPTIVAVVSVAISVVVASVWRAGGHHWARRAGGRWGLHLKDVANVSRVNGSCGSPEKLITKCRGLNVSLCCAESEVKSDCGATREMKVLW